MTPRKSLPSNYIDVEISHIASGWDENPAIEFWHVEAAIGTSPHPRNSFTPKIVIAKASLCRVDLQLCADFCSELDSISSDFGEIAFAIGESEDRLTEYSIVVGQNSSILVVEDVVVDRFWRGNRLGPALLFFAADTLRADGMFLTPVALGTRLDAQGVCVTDYEAPRPGPPGQKKVETAYRRAGFRKLAGDVLWIPTCHGYHGDGPDRSKLARKAIENVEILSNGTRARAWLKRRIGRRTRSTPATGV